MWIGGRALLTLCMIFPVWFGRRKRVFVTICLLAPQTCFSGGGVGCAGPELLSCLIEAHLTAYRSINFSLFI